jgi:hypothetical protein
MEINEIREGDRCELHPATDYWMRGARFGTVTKVGRKWVSVRLDRDGLTTRRFLADQILAIWESDGPIGYAGTYYGPGTREVR